MKFMDTLKIESIILRTKQLMIGSINELLLEITATFFNCS